MNDALLNVLRSVDTPTVCNAIEAAQGKMTAAGQDVYAVVSAAQAQASDIVTSAFAELNANPVVAPVVAAVKPASKAAPKAAK